MAEVKVGRNGLLALVDDEDYERVSSQRWRRARGASGKNYAKTLSGISTISMHRFVLGLTKGDPLVTHENGDGLDNRRANLVVVDVSKPCLADGCVIPMTTKRGQRRSGRGFCYKHYQRVLAHGSSESRPSPRGPTHGLWRGGRFLHDGYVRMQVLPDDPYFQNATPIGGGRYIMEHRLVMAHALGRPLRDDEEVHHLNGVRSDNRLENLELWSISQPSGQRVVDKVIWAKEILSEYEPDALK